MANLACLENLQRLFLGMNRLQDMTELERLEALPNLVELSVVSNAVRIFIYDPMKIISIMICLNVIVNILICVFFIHCIFVCHHNVHCKNLEIVHGVSVELNILLST